jgi:protein tyrosine phosphatase (PTP) superfamily phosphohydrolase (DUF442 family)
VYLLKHIKLDKDSILVGRPREEEWASLADQGYRMVLDILPPELRDKALAKRVKAAGMNYTFIPVESCDLASCKIDEPWVVKFSRFILSSNQYPFILYTDDETLGLSLVVLANLFPEGASARDVVLAVEELGRPLKGRPDIKRFINEYFRHFRHSKGRRVADLPLKTA